MSSLNDLPKDLEEFVRRAATVHDPCLIVGETGTGKTHLARLIHCEGARRGSPFVEFNCAEIPVQLAESHLFGHNRGSFTGALKDRRGIFEQADGSTVFLDEVGELPLSVQPKLLRVCEAGVTRRVGSEKDRSVDVRILAATNQDLGRMIENRRFRADLYFRLGVLVCHVRPLRQRRREIPLLVAAFLSARTEYTGFGPRITEPALRRLVEYHWPGNIRELHNVLSRASVLSSGRRIEVATVEAALSQGIRFARPRTKVAGRYKSPPSAAQERAQILEALEKEGWHRGRAAQRLGMGRTTLYTRMRLYDISAG